MDLEMLQVDLQTKPIIVSPTTPDRKVEYIIEYEYSMETAGGKIIVEILDGHFSDGRCF